MTRASHRALQAASPRHNQLTLDGRRKPKPMPLLEHAPEPKGQDRDFIEWTRRVKVYAGASRGNRERAWKSLHSFTNELLGLKPKATAKA